MSHTINHSSTASTSFLVRYRLPIGIFIIFSLAFTIFLNLNDSDFTPVPGPIGLEQLQQADAAQRVTLVSDNVRARMAARPLSAWRTVSDPVRHIWMIAYWETLVGNAGFERAMMAVRAREETPRLADLLESCQAIGLNATADEVRSAMSSTDGGSTAVYASKGKPPSMAMNGAAPISPSSETGAKFLKSLELEAKQRQKYVSDYLVDFTKP